MGVFGRAFTVVGALLLAAAGVSAYLYATDYAVEATVTDKGEDAGGRFVIVTTEVGGLRVKQYVSAEEWFAIQNGNFVVYHIRSQEMAVFTTQGGQQVYPVV